MAIDSIEHAVFFLNRTDSTGFSNGFSPTIRSIKSGVPQGSNFGPLLSFFLYKFIYRILLILKF